MLVEVLDQLNIPKVIAIGHSWGSMTILRAADKYPNRFESAVLCNMPFQKATPKQKWLFSLQHILLIFKGFYMSQAAKSLYAKTSLSANPQLTKHLKRSMGSLSIKEIRYIDKTVIFNSDDASDMLADLKIKAISINGKDDYLKPPPFIESFVIDGGHVSPLENPQEVLTLIKKFID
jgi:pimeloyl-ACP methyl ester carboxylesterase